MGHRRTPVYTRDFAYQARRIRMANDNIADTPAALFSELISGSMVQIEVGPEKREWTIPKNLLAHHSELLESELQSDSRDRVEKIELHEYDPAGFELFVKFIFQGKLDDVSDMADTQKWDYAVACFQLWRICYRFEMYPLANAASDQYRRGLHEAELVPDAHEIDEIYRQSPAGSPFRKLMTSIAARQIMDPESDRDVESYADCFKDNPQFAIDLITAIKQGTGGMLFDDPTDERSSNTCEYHDHEVAPNCHVKGKGVKQASKISKAVPRLQDPPLRRKSASYDPHTKSDFHLHQALQPPPAPAPAPAPPARKARPQEQAGSAGPLRRRLTSPASSTINLTMENAMASPPSPKAEREKFRKVTPPKRQQETPVPEEPEEPGLHQAPDAHHQSSDEDRLQESHRYPGSNSSSSDRSEPSTKDSVKAEQRKSSPEDPAARRGLWEWARLSSGRMGIIGKRPQSEWKAPGIITTKAATSKLNGALEGRRTVEGSGSLDDFSLLSSTVSEPGNEAQRQEVAAAKLEGLGISNSSGGHGDHTLLFSQTKKSSDDLVASLNGTPSPNALRTGVSSSEKGDTSPLATPPPHPRNRGVANKNDNQKNDTIGMDDGEGNNDSENDHQENDTDSMDSNNEDTDAGGEGKTTPNRHRIPTYKIMLNSNILSPARRAVSAAYNSTSTSTS